MEDDGKIQEPGQRPPLKTQLGALPALLGVLCLLWLVIHFLPRAGDWIGERTRSILEVGDETAATAEKVEKDVGSSPSGNLEDFARQIVEQLGGPARTEVRRIAVSDDGLRLVASIRFLDAGTSSQPREVYFDRDEFGRYRSTEDSPVDEPITVWSE